MLYKKEPNYFTPTLGFTLTEKLNQNNCLWYILQNLNRLTMYNLLAHICKNNTVDTDEVRFDQTLYNTYKQADKNGNRNFCTKTLAIAALRNYRFDTYEFNNEDKKFKQLMPLDLVFHIVEYLP